MNNYRIKRLKSWTLCCGLTLCCVELVAASLSGQTDTTQVMYPDGYRNWAQRAALANPVKNRKNE